MTLDLVWRPTLEVWQGKQVLHHSRMSILMLGQTNLADTILMVGLDPA